MKGGVGEYGRGQETALISKGSWGCGTERDVALYE